MAKNQYENVIYSDKADASEKKWEEKRERRVKVPFSSWISQTVPTVPT